MFSGPRGHTPVCVHTVLSFCLQRVLYFVCSVFSIFCLEDVLYFICSVFYILFAGCFIFCLQCVLIIFCLQCVLYFVYSSLNVCSKSYSVCYKLLLFVIFTLLTVVSPSGPP